MREIPFGIDPLPLGLRPCLCYFGFVAKSNLSGSARNRMADVLDGSVPDSGDLSIAPSRRLIGLIVIDLDHAGAGGIWRGILRQSSPDDGRVIRDFPHSEARGLVRAIGAEGEQSGK